MDKANIAKVASEVAKVEVNRKKTFFSGDVSQRLFIVLSKLPDAKEIILAVDGLKEKLLSLDNLKSLCKNWPSEEFSDLL